MTHIQQEFQTLTDQGIPTYDDFPTKENSTTPLLSAAAMPRDVSSIPAFYDKALKSGLRLQRTLSKHLETERLQFILNNSDRTTSARIHSLKSKHALAAYLARPRSRTRQSKCPTSLSLLVGN